MSCDVWLVGSGHGDLIRKFQSKLHGSLISAVGTGCDVYDDHETLIQTELASFHQQWGAEIKKYGLDFIIVVSPYRPTRVPILYKTNKTALVPSPEYCAVGTGKPISDYLSDRLFEYGRLESRATGILAAFVLREAQHSASGAGLGADMVFIHESGKSLYFIPPAKVKELEECIPPLGECIESCWPRKVVAPEWFVEWT